MAPPCLLVAVSVDCDAARLVTRRIAPTMIRSICDGIIGFRQLRVRRSACGPAPPPANLGHVLLPASARRILVMSWLAILLATIGASLILGALTFVSALIGGLVTSMIVLMCGPLIDRLMARRNRRSA